MSTALPAATDFTGASVTEADFKTAITDQRDFLAGLLGADGAVLTALTTIKSPLSVALAKTGAYTVTAADRGKVVYATGSGGWSLTLPTTATSDVGVGFCVFIKNMTSGVITIARSGSDTIDGATSLTIESGASATLFAAAAAAWVRLGYTAAVTDAYIASHSRVRQSLAVAIAAASNTTQIPHDNTTPLVSEGTQIATLAITPASSSNHVRLNATMVVDMAVTFPATDGFIILAAFRGSTCIGAKVMQMSYDNAGSEVTLGPKDLSISLDDAPATTSATTYTLRIGAAWTGVGTMTWYMNKESSASLNGMLAKSVMTLEEITA